MTEKTIERRLPVVERVGHGFSVNYLDSLLQLQKKPPFDGSFCAGKIHTVVDFDGVVPEGNYLNNVANLRTLSKIGEKSETVDIHTSRLYYNDFNHRRINLDFTLGNQFQPVSDFPWLTESSEFFIEEMIRGAVVEGKKTDRGVSFVTGLKKLVGGNQIILDKSKKVLDSGDTLVMIGSSIFDVLVARAVYSDNKKAIKWKENFFCYNTGHWLI